MNIGKMKRGENGTYVVSLNTMTLTKTRKIKRLYETSKPVPIASHCLFITLSLYFSAAKNLRTTNTAVNKNEITSIGANRAMSFPGTGTYPLPVYVTFSKTRGVDTRIIIKSARMRIRKKWPFFIFRLVSGKLRTNIKNKNTCGTARKTTILIQNSTDGGLETTDT